MPAARRIFLIQLAGGQGVRAGTDVPKQFTATGRGPLFAVSLRSFLEFDDGGDLSVAAVAVVVPESWRALAAEALQGLRVPWILAQAGPTRTASTANGVAALAGAQGSLPRPEASDLLAVHDAARPFATGALLQAVARAADGGCAVPGIQVVDTIVRAPAGGPAEYLARAELRAVQTPQVMRWDVGAEAHRWAAATGAEFTDDGSLLAARGVRPTVVPGDPGNWKVTSAGDLERALAALSP